MLVQAESYTVPASPDYPFFLKAKRYWTKECTEDPSAQTLIVLHSTSFHKETWEPALEDLFALLVSSASAFRAGEGTRAKGTRVAIREAWMIDCPNHGESATLNHRALSTPEYANYVSCTRYAEAVHRFLTLAPVDFSKRNMIGIGHSLGANSMLILQHLQPIYTFSALIIIEPMVSALGLPALNPLRDRLLAEAERRNDRWGSRDEARKMYRERKKLQSWDRRVVDAFVNHAIYWNNDMQAFTLCCSRQQEKTMYIDEEGPLRSFSDLNRLCKDGRIPVHLILGEIPDFIPKRVQEALIAKSSGRRFASSVTMKGVGHLIPQEKPTELAKLIFDILVKTYNSGGAGTTSSARPSRL
ncbi:hypothetical protein NLJ89_g6793 [Agrocybe chaxingu]|uniref:AB hydrolase-1 domain-containing protein n=1 Tax=Agrocybe chaxingu TaxID=84603 RepID=A0A9W8JXL4_9AGAR|nr:hypothetical protein NLJ89_g6793 [Agrocybe chaxingu]